MELQHLRAMGLQHFLIAHGVTTPYDNIYSYITILLHMELQYFIADGVTTSYSSWTYNTFL